ncbi:MAG: hydantoinase B/oxoprolinase family protein [Rhodospirillaceae bacterium]|jgi:N-methylhydantoinase B|nr:hydantoinase B/oxoprolinase family protein [Rhodospirillaceae bacterium]MBT5081727.1 hydantoinase B/oxoprolinase family protein [Rhodospirillaceae bacterium]MBT5527411.1 hydantoinase B/oxoprolinase family protein [Rhodospirillaceae bacterium]MBT5880700.1 hydantoinase B/oxoprolinase family protein [Rhodospirillaceae bacterium]MBT6589821.1 hydantoinase B/oxoprolinase family protein [Rhodospirillaceae bacterium]
MPNPELNAVRLGLIWRRLDGIVDQVAETFLRAAFSVVVRDNYDMAFSLFDSQGRQLTQSKRSIPSFLGTLPRTLDAVLDKFPIDKLSPGDVIISNNAWIGTGHLNDISMVHPIFRGNTLVAFAASTAHTVDIGGAPSPNAKDCYEEGLCIPICKIVVAGEDNPVVMDFLTENLRQPDETLGDVRAQFAAYRDCNSKLMALLDEEGLDDLIPVADEIIARSEQSMRAAIAALPDGTYSDGFDIDGVDVPLRIECQVTIAGEELTVDFAGTSPQVPWPINSVLNYTQAYARYAVKCLVDPDAPNNAGSLAPVHIKAPEGSLLNATPPAPVWGRHLSGHYVPPAIIGAMAPIMSDQVVAESGSPLWNVYFAGRYEDETRGNFVKMFFMNGGHGARSKGDGPGCLSFPSNVSNQPIEAFEHQVPMLVREKSFIPDSGGIGKYRGGNAQRLVFEARSENPITMTIRHERISYPPRGLLGGAAGRAGIDQINGQVIPAKSRSELKSGDVVVFETPGGGGLYPPGERDDAMINQDLESGLTTSGASREAYGND